MKRLSILAGKLGYNLARLKGENGTALPGKIALSIDKNILEKLGKNCEKIVFITGTNGKTTTNNISNQIFDEPYPVISNLTGSNMIQGVATPLILNSRKNFQYGIFEVDEGSVPEVSENLTPDYLIITNFFRDQLDRYGEVENTIMLIHDSITDPKTKLILNADDPSSMYFNDLPNEKIYYSQNKTKISQESINVEESVFCPKCGKRLNYEYINYGNIGKFYCENCDVKSPEAKYVISDIEVDNEGYDFVVNGEKIRMNILGLYNLYNALSSIALAREEGIDWDIIKNEIGKMEYKRGRMENFQYGEKDVVLGLSKNPIGLTEVFHTISYNDKSKEVMFILNDYAPDGRDISWIWDADFNEVLNIPNLNKFYCVGTRAEEVALRLKYEGFPEEKLAISHSEDETDIEKPIDDILSEESPQKYIIGTFTAMPEARKILVSKTGGK